MVVLSHALSFHYGMSYAGYSRYFIFNLGSMGVAIFFLLSGFLISYTVSRKIEDFPEYTVEVYLVERFARIYVVFLPALVLTALLCVGKRILGDPDMAAFTLRHFLLTLAMLSGVQGHLAHGETFELIAPAWTLNYEFFFYFLFGLLVIHRSNLGRRWSWVWAPGFLVILAATSSLHFVALLAYNWVLGVMVGNIFRMRTGSNGDGRFDLIILVAGVVPVVLWLMSGGPRASDAWITTTALGLAFLVLLETANRIRLTGSIVRGAHVLASFSYSLYLLHFAILSILSLVFYRLRFYDPGESDWRKATVFLASIVVANILTYIFSLVTERHTNRVRSFLLSRFRLSRTAPETHLAPSVWTPPSGPNWTKV